MKKRLLKVAITTALTVAFAVPAFANPFSDVPAKHWAYDAVNKLAQAGIVDGYADGTFRGDRTLSRYEMAAIIAKSMNKTMNADQKATMDRLSKEFAAELDTMGVKVAGMQNQIDNMVKVSGDARVRFFDHSGATGSPNSAANPSKDVTDYRARIAFDGRVNDNLKFNARLATGNNNEDNIYGMVRLDTANVSFDVLGMNTTVGRQDIKLGTGYLMDTQMNGIQGQIAGLKLFAGNATSTATVNKNDAVYGNLGMTANGPVWNRVYGAEYNTDILGAKLTADYLKDTSSKDNFYGANTSFRLVDGVTANAEYYKNSETSATAKAYGVKFDNIGLSATYRNVAAGAVNPFSTMFASTTNLWDDLSANGFKGMEYQYDRNLDKNTTMTVKYQDFKDQNNNKLDSRASAAINVKF